MIKVRAMGSVEDIEWLAQQLENSEEIELLDRSEIFTLQGTNNFFRAYFQVERKEKIHRELRINEDGKSDLCL